jgi:hypothetical protein
MRIGAVALTRETERTAAAAAAAAAAEEVWRERLNERTAFSVAF